MRSNALTTTAIALVLWSIPGATGAAIVVLGALSQEKTVEVGKTYQGAIRVRNPGDTPQTVRIYQTDYRFFSDGRNLYGEPGKDPRSNANWITLSPTLLTIPPKEEVAVNYRIAVPADKSLRGTYWSMIMVEGTGDAGSVPLAAVSGKARIAVRQVIRYGVQVVTDIGDTGTRNLKLNARLVRADGKRLLQVDVANTGERWLRPSLWAQLFDEKGKFIGKFAGASARVYPGTSIRKSIDLSSVSVGTYKALVVADAHEDSVYGATYTLKLGREKAAK